MELAGKPVSDRIIRLVSLEYGVSEHWIRTGEGEMYSEEENLNEVKVNSIFKSLNPTYQESTLAILNILADLQGK